MKILILGANGQVGWELQRALAPLGGLKACCRAEADFEDLNCLRQVIRHNKPDVIVNAAAYTAVDQAESEPDKAYHVNVKAVEVLAQEARRLDAWLIHYSTDYVFDGKKQSAYVETDPTCPLNVYGKTKCQGEEVIRNSHDKHLILRTSWVYAARGANFVHTMIKLAKTRDDIKVVADQIGAPTSAQLIADTTACVLNKIMSCVQSGANTLCDWQQVAGTYHLTPMGKTSWHGFAQHVIETAGRCGLTLRVGPDSVSPISSAAYGQLAARPANSLLNTHKLTDTFGIVLPSWQNQVEAVITTLIEQGDI